MNTTCAVRVRSSSTTINRTYLNKQRSIRRLTDNDEIFRPHTHTNAQTQDDCDEISSLLQHARAYTHRHTGYPPTIETVFISDIHIHLRPWKISHKHNIVHNYYTNSLRPVPSEDLCSVYYIKKYYTTTIVIIVIIIILIISIFYFLKNAIFNMRRYLVTKQHYT